jgi:acetyltransferase-like isoleucine patch superfamily enzyme
MLRIFLNFLLKKMGKNYEINSFVPNSHLIRLSILYLVNFTRWKIKAPRFLSKIIFLGRNSKIINQNQLFIGNKTRIGKNVYIDCLSKEGFHIGEDVNIGDNCYIKATWKLDDIGVGFKIGNGSSLGENSFVGAAGGVTIGENVISGQSIRFHSENHIFTDINIPIKYQGISRKGITIEDDCWLGAGTVFLDGVKVGKGSVIGANSVVTKDVPPYSIVIGSSATVIKTRSLNKNLKF